MPPLRWEMTHKEGLGPVHVALEASELIKSCCVLKVCRVDPFWGLSNTLDLEFARRGLGGSNKSALWERVALWEMKDPVFLEPEPYHLAQLYEGAIVMSKSFF